MKILFISKSGDALDLAYRLYKEGNFIRFYIEEKEERQQYDGFPIEKVNNYIPSIQWADLIIFDTNDLETEKRLAKNSKKPVFGIAYKNRISILGKTFNGYEFGEQLEQDRKFGHKLFEHFGIGKRFEMVEFNNIDKAIDYLNNHNGPYVIKPESKQPIDSSLTLIGEMEDNRDTIIYLEGLKLRKEIGIINKIELEKRILGCCEIACGGFFNGKDWLALDINFEHKKFATGNKNNIEGQGFSTGEMGTIIKKVGKDNKLFRETLYKMTDWLKEVDFRGNLDINTIIDKNGDIYPLEFTPRCGYPSIYIEQELHKTRWTDFLYTIASGEDLEVEFYDEWAIGAVLLGEGFPTDEAKERMKYIPVIYDEEIKDNLHFCEVIKNGDDILTIGAYVLVATAKGKTIENAKYNLYNNVLTKVYVPKSYYRTDISDRVVKQLEDYSFLKEYL
jgi:phosphoribosylamine--glycine ligase